MNTVPDPRSRLPQTTIDVLWVGLSVSMPSAATLPTLVRLSDGNRVAFLDDFSPFREAG